MNDSIGIYLNDIGKVPLLTAEDERVLSRAIEKGREAAAKKAAGEKKSSTKKTTTKKPSGGGSAKTKEVA